MELRHTESVVEPRRLRGAPLKSAASIARPTIVSLNLRRGKRTHALINSSLHGIQPDPMLDVGGYREFPTTHGRTNMHILTTLKDTEECTPLPRAETSPWSGSYVITTNI